MAATAVGAPLAEAGGWLGPVGFLLGVAGPALLFLLPGLGLTAVLTRRRELGVPETVAAVMVGSGVAFIVVFWAFLWSPTAGYAAAALSVLGGTAAWSANVRGPRAAFLPFSVGAGVAVVAVSLAFTAGGVAGADHTVAERYRLSPDNAIPAVVGRRLVAGDSLRTPRIMPGWQMSDRPPLQVGATVGLLPLVGNDSLGYQLGATALQAWWVPAMVAMLLALGFGRRTSFLAVPLVAGASVVYLDTVYVWPKFLAGAIVLAGVAAARAPNGRSLLWLLAGSVALGLLAHGGVAFALPACAWLARDALRRVSWRCLATAVAVGVALYAPWIAYQRLYDPPGDRLLRWHLAGDLREFAPPFTEVLAASYRMPLEELVQAKARNVAALSATPWRWGDNKGAPAWTNVPGRLRTGLTSNLLLAPGILLLAVPALRRDRRAWPLVGMSAGTAMTSALLEHGGSWEAAAWMHHTSYVAIITWTAVGALGALALVPRWRRIVIAAHGMSFAWLWLFLGRNSTLTGQGTYEVNASACIAALLGCGALAVLLWAACAERVDTPARSTGRLSGARPRSFRARSTTSSGSSE